MVIDGGQELLERNLKSQLTAYWSQLNFNVIHDCIPIALQRMSCVLEAISKGNKYVWRNAEATFSPMNSVQYSVFLYSLSNTIFQTGGD